MNSKSPQQQFEWQKSEEPLGCFIDAMLFGQMFFPAVIVTQGDLWGSGEEGSGPLTEPSQLSSRTAAVGWGGAETGGSRGAPCS